jgi:hypothetical protein
MTEIAKALEAFYGSFGLEAYTEDRVPDDAKTPYITYTVPQSEIFYGVTHQCRVWYYGTGNTQAAAKADEILAAIGQGVKLRAGSGYVCIYPGTPKAQMQPADDTTQIVYLNLELRSYV